MAANSDGYIELSAILTCEGDLSDPRFPTQLNVLVDSLNNILGESVTVHKLEPWNSVRVTLSIPREAALRLRQLANEGSQHLRALGILSVQVEGDQVISLRIASGSEPQEIILRTSQDGSNSSNSTHHESDLGNFLQTNAISTTPSSGNNVQVQFKSPNVVCPPDSVVPKVGTNTVLSNNISGSNKPYAGPFPFTSMNQAIHSNRETPFNSLPPPYPAKHPPVTISSPLLVNLLQNDGSGGGKDASSSSSGIQKMRTTPTPSDISTSSTVNCSSSGPSSNKPILSTQANSSISPSALSTNTSIRQNSTVMTSTSGMVNKTPSGPLPPPQYHRSLSNPTMVKQIPVTGHQNINNIISSTTHPSQSQNIMTHVTQSTAVPIQQQQQNSIYQQPQQHLTATSLKNNLSQPKHLISQKPVTSHAFNKNMATPLVKTIPQNPQQRTIVSNLMNNTHQKLIGANSIPKNPNIYLPHQHKIINKSNFPPTVLPQSAPLATPSISNNPLDIPSSSQNYNNNSNINNSLLLRPMPSPPPYSVAISRPWDSLVVNNTNSLLDLTPTLTDLKADDLDALLPTLERELSHSPLPELPEDFLADHSNLITTNDDLIVNDNRKFLINPLTGELEPQSSGESDTEEMKDVFTGLPSPANLSDEDTCSTTRPDTTTDQSDSETRSSDTNKPPRLKNSSKVRERGRDSPALKPEKIKLRLKLEKSEPVNPAYKVDISFINQQQPKKGMSSLIAGGEEPRVPPLHISLRGRNSAVIKNKNRLNPDGTPVKLKVRKNQEHLKVKKNDTNLGSPIEDGANVNSLIMDVPNSMISAEIKARIAMEQKKIKKLKANHEHKDVIASLTQDSDLKSKFVIHNHYKDKQKERRGSDSELVKSKKFLDGAVILDEKKRRLSQSEQPEEEQPILGSTNVGTIAGLPQKVRKDKLKIKDVFKKDINKTNKIFNKNFTEKLQTKSVTLPTAGEMNMEAKFKQGLLEGTGEKGIPRPPHRTEIVNHLSTESKNRLDTTDMTKVIPETTPIKEKSPEPDKCNTPNNRKSVDSTEKPSVSVSGSNGNRSPNSGGNQGEDSGIESMDALSEKSPNQASQSPHADILPPKTQVPNMLDIEAQLAKMEGLNGDSDRIGDTGTETGPVEEDVNENKCRQDQAANCCKLTCALQDTIKQDLDPSSPISTNKQIADSNIGSHKVKKDDDLEPLPVRVTPALYTYSNQEKSRGDSESPALSDDDSNSCSTTSTLPGNKQSKSLLEQLLIEIPNDHQGIQSSPSPATRSSVRTRALSKLNSPELNSPIPKNALSRAGSTGSTKRKRNESDSSNQSLDETKKKSRRNTATNETTTDSAIKQRHDSASSTKPNNINKKHTKVQERDESSDSDEPLIEKIRKSSSVNINNTQVKGKPVKVGGQVNVANNSTTSVSTTITGPPTTKTTMVVSTRRSVRSNMPAQNTRSKGENNKIEVKTESDALRRKTRSAVSDVENKRKKEVK